MIAEGFAAAGARTTLLPGGEVFSALEKGTVDAADYTGPAVNWDLGFQQVTKYIWTGPPGLESIYQPVDLMDFVVNMDVWNKLSPKMKLWVENEVEAYSAVHFGAIQKADMETWPKFEKAGTQIIRMPSEDLRQVAAHRDADLVQVGEQGQGRGASVQGPARDHGVADRRLRDARHVQGPEDRSLRSATHQDTTAEMMPSGIFSAVARLRVWGLRVMPHLNFVLPHWLYWGTLLLFPLIAMYLVERQRRRGVPRGPSLFIAYLFWLCSGFMGLHRFYLRSMWGFAFIPVFLVILYVSDTIRDHREDVSRTHAAYEATLIEVNRAKIPAGVPATPAMTERAAKSAGRRGQGQSRGRRRSQARWIAGRAIRRWLAILMAVMLLVDAVLLPGLVRARQGARGGRARQCAAGGRRARRAADRHARRPDDAHAHARHRQARMAQRPDRRIRRLLGGDLGVRLLLRSHRALRVQFADQLGAREHVPDVRHAIHAVRRLRLSRRPARARRRVLLEVLAARQSDRRHRHLGVLLHLHPHDAVDRHALRARRHQQQRSVVHRVGHPVLAGQADAADRRGADGAARALEAHQGHRLRHAAGGPEPWDSKSTSHG